MAQNILKNERTIKRYKDLDTQLQNTTFQYFFKIKNQIAPDEHNGPDAECDDRNGEYNGPCE